MSNEINAPTVSKINWTAGIMAVSNIAVLKAANFGLIPEGMVADALVVGNVASYALIAVFRTWYTKR